MSQVKICPSCGLENPLCETMCLRYMADISSVTPADSDDVIDLAEKKIVLVCSSTEGRGIPINFLTVSRRHARFYYGSTWTMEDMNSTTKAKSKIILPEEITMREHTYSLRSCKPCIKNVKTIFLS